MIHHEHNIVHFGLIKGPRIDFFFVLNTVNFVDNGFLIKNDGPPVNHHAPVVFLSVFKTEASVVPIACYQNNHSPSWVSSLSSSTSATLSLKAFTRLIWYSSAMLTEM